MERRNLKLSSSKPGSRKAACWKQSWGEEIKTYKYTKWKYFAMIPFKLKAAKRVQAEHASSWLRWLGGNTLWGLLPRGDVGKDVQVGLQHILINLKSRSRAILLQTSNKWYDIHLNVSIDHFQVPKPGQKAENTDGRLKIVLESEKERRIPIIGLHQCEALT